MSEKIINNLHEHKTALVNYLDDMLHQATASVSCREGETTLEIDRRIIPPALIQPSENVESENTSARLKEDPAPFDEPDNPEKIDKRIGSPDAIEAEAALESLNLTEDMFPVQCLMFKVGGSQLSIPLTELNSVVNWQDNLSHLPGEPDWIMGVLKHRNNHVKVIDSAAILQVKREVEKSPEFIIVLNDKNWGISCDQIDKVISLNYEDVQWSKNQANRMTRGTIRDSLSSLLNPQGIVKCLSN